MAVRDEVLRFLVETKGDESLRALVREIIDIGDAGSDSEKDLKRLLDQVGDSAKLERAAAGYRKVGAEVLATGRELQAAQSKVREFSNSLDAEPTRKQAAELERLRSQVKGVAAEYDAQKTRLSAYRAEIVSLGGSVAALGTTERAAGAARVAAIAGVERLAGALREQSASAKQAAADRAAGEKQAAEAAQAAERAARQLAQTEAEAARQSRSASAQRQAQLKADAIAIAQVKAAAEQAAVADIKAAAARAKAARDGSDALERYNIAQRKASAETDQLASKSSRLGSVLSSLRGLLASVATFLGFRAAVDGIKNILGLGAASEDLRRSLNNLFGGVEAGGAAFDALKKLSKDTGQDFGSIADQARKLKAFGLDPLNGSLLALIDQNAAAGGSQQDLEGKVLALGQAWAKQKLQGEEILQLVERGVPVWDLLQKVTGKNVEELQKLSEQGKLGRDVIAALIDEIGRVSDGAAADSLGSLSGLFQQARDRADDFLRMIGDSGVVQFFKENLQKLNAEIDRLASNGTLQQYARGISDAIVGVADALKGAAVFVINYASELKFLAKAFVAVKVAEFLSKMAEVSSSLAGLSEESGKTQTLVEGLADGVGGLGARIKALPKSVLIGFAVAGLDAAYEQVTKIRQSLTEFAGAEDALRITEERLAKVNAEIAAEYGRRAEALKRYSEVTRLAKLDVITLADAERQAYGERLKGNVEYLDALTRQKSRQVEVGQATREELTASIAKLREAQAALAEYQELLNGISVDGLSAAVRQVIRDMQGAQDSAGAAEKKFDDFFKTVNFQTVDSSTLGNFAQAIARMGQEALVSGRNIKEGLTASLQKLSGEELLKFQQKSQDAFKFYFTAPKEAALVLESTLLAALNQLGVESSQLGVKFTESGQQTIAAFQAVATNAVATGDQIEAAFTAAIRAAATSGELDALGAALRGAFDQGRLGVTDFEQSTLALNQRMRELRAEVDPLRQSFEALGITSQQSLADARDTAKEAFEAIESGAKRGEASLGDVRAAFEAYAQKALAAAASSSEWERENVAAALRIKGEVIGAAEELERLGLAGKDAGEQAADGLNAAGDALSDLTDKAAGASDSLQGVGSAADGTADALGNAASQAGTLGDATDRLGISLGAVSSEFAEQNRQISEGFGGRDLFIEQQRNLAEELERQRSAAGDRIRQLDQELARYDPLTKYLEEARQAYGYLDDAALRSIAEREQRLDQARKRAAEEAAREEQQAASSSARRQRDYQEELRQQDELDRRARERDASAAGGGARLPDAAPRPAEKRIVELVLRNEQTGSAPVLQLSPTQIRQITDAVLREIETARIS